MSWRCDEEIVWHKYSKTDNGHLPLLYMRLNYQGKATFGAETFILDSGAVATAIPEEYVSKLLDLSQYIREKTGLTDAHGRQLEGVRLPLELVFQSHRRGEFIYVQETVWCCAGIRRGLLGQGSIFEQLGTIFLNFPDASGARFFGLFRRPGSSEILSFHTPGAWANIGTRSLFFTDHEVIELEGNSGLLQYTRAEFADFDLEVDWCAQTSEDKAGVCLRLPSLGSAGQPLNSQSSIEILIKAQGSETRWREAVRPVGERNTLLIKARGRELRLFLNTKEVHTMDAPAHALRSGGIGLRSHPGSRMRFRALRIQRR
ncbi:family 16 glycoside hydrolase [Archangium sp.]|uniref:family 16 glycoside hydrolase n=1 Tax=Archangium sp. TaxID=1872627 RepID=UPI00286C2B2E|nr:family 16 glycoside hydrolase [Archangium sp.]